MMLIDNAVQSTASTARLNALADARRDSAAPFVLEASETNRAGSNAKSGKPQPTIEKLLKELTDYIDKGPIVDMREKILKSMGLSEEKLKALPPEARQAVEAEIAERIKEILLKQQEMTKSQQTNGQKVNLYRSLDEA